MRKYLQCLVAISFVCLSGYSMASDSLPGLLNTLEKEEIQLIDESVQSDLRGEYIKGSDSSGQVNAVILAAKRLSFCGPAYIICRGVTTLSPTEQLISFSFRSTPGKIEYRRY